MPLPQAVIEQLRKPSIKTPGWSSGLLMFSGALLVIALVVYFGLILGYQPYLNAQDKNLNDQIQKFSQQIPASDQEKLIVFYSQLVNLKKLLQQHIFTSPLFEWLEKNTLPTIYYTKFSLDTNNHRLNLSGSAKTVEDFAKQVLFFNNQPEVQSISFNNITSGQNKIWQFDLIVTFKESIFQKVFGTAAENPVEATSTNEEE